MRIYSYLLLSQSAPTQFNYLNFKYLTWRAMCRINIFSGGRPKHSCSLHCPCDRFCTASHTCRLAPPLPPRCCECWRGALIGRWPGRGGRRRPEPEPRHVRGVWQYLTFWQCCAIIRKGTYWCFHTLTIKNLLLRRVSQVFEPQIATNLASKTNGLFTKDPQNRPLTHRLTTFAKKHHNFKWRLF